MRTAEFDFDLPAELIAQTPLPCRDHSRLLVLRRKSGQIEHRSFGELLHYLKEGDVLVLNNSRVIPARLWATNARTGGEFEILLLEQHAVNDWWAMMRPAKRARPGTVLLVRAREGGQTAIEAKVVEKNAEGHGHLQFSGTTDLATELEELGETPLPPYIRRGCSADTLLDRQRYQTVFARPPGSVAAPTAGLHFTHELLEKARQKGVAVCYLTLHVGVGTFAPVKSETLAGHSMHEERYELSEETVRQINQAKAGGHRIVAVGTTTVRVLESVAARNQGRLASGSGRTRIFIYPPFEFRIVDTLLTNFHLPRSTLLMLVSAFAAPGQTGGTQLVLNAYAEAVRERYRFFSYGDAMLLY